MEQQSAALGFREVDRDGNTVLPASDDTGTTRVGGHRFAPNPFIVVLWVMAAALIAGGVGTLLRGPVAIGPLSNGFSFDFVLFTFAPQLALTGFATAVFLLFWHAWHWQRHRA
ncbi:hypothetical protein ACTHQ6_13220 [Arthrobacter sp. SAFR-179]|uniref:hypothetical protein n=1 Tax=Arthrobacter sp. SAFR-179 TaxID=3387279 RepID=UPI003F7CCF86